MFSRRFPGFERPFGVTAVLLAALAPSVFASTLFDTVLHFPTGNGPQCIRVGDFDGDPHPDLATANYAVNTFSILPGSQDGTFGGHIDFPTGAGPISLAIGDLNHDSFADVVTSDQLDGTVSVFLGTGSRSFGPRTAFAVGVQPYGIAIGLVNADLDPDIVVANQGSNTVSVLLGNGSGSFGGRIDLATDLNPRGIFLGELNNVPGLDIAVANISHHTISLFFGHGDGTFDSMAPIYAGYYCWGIAAGYLNNDANLDLATPNAGDATASVLLGNGNGTFAAPTYFTTEAYPQAIAIADLDGGGTLDLAVVNSAHHTVSVLLGDGNGGFATQMSFTAGSSPNSVAIADFNHDSKMDLAFSNEVPNTVTILLNTGEGPVGACCEPATGVCTVTTETACDAPSAWQGAGTVCDPNPCPHCPIVAWGDNTYGEISVPAPNTDFVSLEAGDYHSLGVKADGSIVAWGFDGLGQCDVPSPNGGFVAAAGGGGHSLGLKADGSIVAWGLNNFGQGIAPSPNSGFVAIAAATWHSLGLKSDGSIVAWGDNGLGQCNVPSPNSDFVAINASSYHSLGLKSDGSIAAWGDNTYGQCDVPSPNAGFIAIAAGGRFSLGLKSDGRIVAWGWNYWGQCNVPAPNTDFVAIAAGGMHALGLKSDGSVVAWGWNEANQCIVPSPNIGYTAIAGGVLQSLALRCRVPHTISATAGPNGALSPSGSVNVNYGDSQTFYLTPDPCYKVMDVLVDNNSVGAVTSYTFTNVVSWHSIVAIFGPASAPTPQRLEAWWTFDDFVGPKFRDLAHYNSGVNAGTLEHGATLVPGIVGNAIRCTGPQDVLRIQLSQNSIYTGNRGFAVDAWIYLLPGSPPIAERMIANFGSFRFMVQDHRLVVGTVGTSFRSTAPQLTEDEWHHVAVTLYPSMSAGSFYIDGVQAGAFAPPCCDAVTDAYIGNNRSGGGAPFNGYIDEVDVFRASLNGPPMDGPIIRKIWEAGCAGKRREFVRLPLWADVCGNHVTKSCAVFTNLTNVPQVYDWRMRRLIGVQCGGDPAFSPPAGSLAVPAGGIVSIPVGIYYSGCFRMDVQSRVTSSAFYTEGFIQSDLSTCTKPRGNCVAPPVSPPPGTQLGSLRSSENRDLTPTAAFTLYNEADVARSIPCRIEGIDGDSGERSEALRLNDLDWGAPLDQIVEVAAHDSVEVGVTVTVDANNPFQTAQIRLSADLDGDSTFEPLASTLIEAAEDTLGAADVIPHAPLPIATSMTVVPNPFSDRTVVHLSLPETRELEIAVFDVSGRRIRSLHSGRLEAGEHQFVWDGRSSGDRVPMSGIYFVRVRMPGTEQVEKVLRLN